MGGKGGGGAAVEAQLAKCLSSAAVQPERRRRHSICLSAMIDAGDAGGDNDGGSGGRERERERSGAEKKIRQWLGNRRIVGRIR